MDLIGILLSGPVPVAVSSVIALSCLAAIWFFALPLLEEAKELRSRNEELQNTVTSFIESAGPRDGEVHVMLVELAGRLEGFDGSQVKRLIEASDAVVTSSTANGKQIAELSARLESVANSLAVHIEAELTFGREANREIERLSRALEQLNRQLTDISERQSQFTGILTGMTMAKNANRSL